MSERLNRTFKALLRRKLNKVLKKSHNKTNTVQLIREAKKYNFQNLIDITKEVVSFYNTKKPHEHLNYLPPDTWAYEARLLPNQTHVLIPKKESDGLSEPSDVVKMLKEKDPKEREKHIQIVSNVSLELGLGQNMADENPDKVFEKIVDLNKNLDIIPVSGFAKDDNSESAKQIRRYKSHVGVASMKSGLTEEKVKELSLRIKTVFGELLVDHEEWETDVERLETIEFQGRLLLSNVEKLQNELRERTEVLQSQNQELLDKNEELLGMNRYLVDKAKEAEEERRKVLEKKLKRQNAKKQPRRDYISPDEFYEIVDKLVYKCEDSRYIIARQRIAYFIMYFTGLRVSNLLLLTRRHLHELINDSYTEIPLIKGGRPNQLIGIGEDAQDLLENNFIDDISIILKDKEDDEFVFTSEHNRFASLHRVTFTRDLNKTLRYASEHFHKKITCHSFRVTFITEGIEKGIALHVMQKAIGHQSIKSTEHYVRHDLSPLEWTKIVKTINRDRVNQFTIKIQENIARKNKKGKKTNILASNANVED